MKAYYVRPEMTEVLVAVSSMLSASLTINSTSQGDHNEDFANGRRGVWGNLWAGNDKER